MVALATFVNRSGMMVLPFLAVYLTTHLHVSPSRAGLALGVYGLGGMVTAPFVGRLADRFGALPVLRVALFASGVMLLAMPLFGSFGGILALTFVWAIAADGARPATMSALTDAVDPSRRKAAIALNRLATNLGMSIGPAVGGFLALVSFPLMFVVDAATSLAAAAIVSGFLAMRSRGDSTDRIEVAASSRASPFAASSFVWRDRRALGFLVTALLVNIVYVQQQGAMPLYVVRDLGYRESFFGALFVINTLMVVALEVPINLATANWPGRSGVALSTLLIGAGYGALGLARAPLPIALTVVVWTFGEMMFYPAATAYVAELAPTGRTGEYMGALSGAFSLALIVGPWAGAVLLERAGAPTTWAIMFACGVVGAVTVVVTQSGLRDCRIARRESRAARRSAPARTPGASIRRY